MNYKNKVELGLGLGLAALLMLDATLEFIIESKRINERNRKAESEAKAKIAEETATAEN